MKALTCTILSFSLLTIMSAAAVAPALGLIGAHFPGAHPLLIKFVISLPPAFIILVSLFFGSLCRVFRTRTLALLGIFLYVAAGSGAFFVDSLALLLVCRALLGVSVGVLMPLSVGLLAYCYPPTRMAKLMGFSAAMNQLGGVIATLLAGYLATFSWNDAFLVYLLGLVVAVLVVLCLPNADLRKKERGKAVRVGVFGLVRDYWRELAGMMCCTVIFFVFVSNFALVESARGRFSPMAITFIMVASDLVAVFAGALFGKLFQRAPHLTPLLPPLVFAVGYALLVFAPTAACTVIATLLIGIANGIGVPYFNAVASLRGGRQSVTTILPLLSATLFLGQFLSPVLMGLLPLTPYAASLLLSGVYLILSGSQRLCFSRRGRGRPPCPPASRNAWRNPQAGNAHP